MDNRIRAILYALLAAAFYAANIPVSKILLSSVEPTFMAAFLYLGAGVGIGIMLLYHNQKNHQKNQERAEKLTRQDLPYTVGMILLDIAAPILLMLGISIGSPANASLLGNFEIVATSLIALYIFHESVSVRLWIAVSLITLSSMILSFDNIDGLKFSIGSLFVLGAAACWGLENNCTRQISHKSAYEIVILKGLFSGGGAFVIALVIGETFPEIKYIFYAMILGFVAYGLSIFFYIRAQSVIGAAKTSAYYAVAPFIGVFLSFIFFHENLTWRFLIALLVMAAGSILVVADTLILQHAHTHSHILTRIHNGKIYNYTIIHSHPHNHYGQIHAHRHFHSASELERQI